MIRALLLASVVLSFWMCCGAVLAQSDVITVAVLPFENVTKDAELTWLGYGFAETLATKLSNISTIQLVERNQLSKALQELKLQDTALVDAKTAGQLGKIVGAKYVIIGSYQKLGGSLKADARRVEVETSVASSGVDVMGEFEKTLSLECDLALKLVSALGKTPTEPETKTINKVETQSLSAHEWLSKGAQLYFKPDLDGAIEHYNKAIELDANYALALSCRGLAYYDKGLYDLAIADFDKVLAMDAKDTTALNNRGISYGKKDDWDKAAADFDKVIEIDPNDGEAHYNRGKVYSWKQDYDRAFAEFDKAISINPNDAVSYIRRGTIYFLRKDYEHAIPDYDKAISIDPKDPDVYAGKGVAHMQNKQIDEALAAMKKYLEIAPATDSNIERITKLVGYLEQK